MSLFEKPKVPKPPTPSDKEVEDERVKRLRAAQLAQGRRSTLVTGAAGVGESPIGRPTLVSGLQ